MHYFILPTKDLSKLFSSCKSHYQCKPPEATELKKIIAKLCFLHMPNSQANILHLDQKAAKSKTCKWLYGQFQLLIAHQLPENHSSSSKWVKFFGEARKEVGVGVGVGSLERVSLILIYMFMNSFIYTVFNLWITRSIRNKLLWALRHANVSLRCRHLS